MGGRVGLRGQSVLVTGGTGSFGRAFVRELLDNHGPARVAVFSRDELKQHEMRVGGFDDERVRWFIGDVRDRDRLTRAMAGVDVVVHAAALKQVVACEYNPLEAVKTNVDGAANVISAALDCHVGRVLALSTDKAVDPVNLYGATKLVAEKLFVDANVYSRKGGTRFACTRYGNVISSRGSVLPLFLDALARCAPMRVTDLQMTRFVLTLQQGVRFVLDRLADMQGGEVFVPCLPAVTVETIARSVSWPREPAVEVVGVRQGEKMHELLLSENESGRAAPYAAGGLPSHFVVTRGAAPAACLTPGYRFGSDTAERLDVAAFRSLAGLGATLEAAS